LEQHRAYRFNHPKYAQSVLYIHRLYRKTNEARVKFSEIKLVESGNGYPKGVFVFSQWDHCGKEEDAETLRLDPRRHPIEEEWQVDSPPPRYSPLRGLDHSGSKTVKVKWACARSGMELRNLNNVGTRVSIATRDAERLSQPWTVHEYNCGMGENTAALLKEGLSVTVGIELNENLGKTWIVHTFFLEYG
jgi:hypothetical protein